jgi:hypothetical protein
MDLMQDLRNVDGILGAFLDEMTRESGFVRGKTAKNGHSKKEIACPHCGQHFLP